MKRFIINGRLVFADVLPSKIVVTGYYKADAIYPVKHEEILGPHSKVPSHTIYVLTDSLVMVWWKRDMGFAELDESFVFTATITY